MKKILAILLIVCCMLSVVSCNKDKGDDTNNNNSSNNDNNNNNNDNNTDDTDNDNNGGNTTEADDVLARFTKMLAESVPTASTTVVTQNINESVIVNTFSVVTGTVNNVKAAVYTNEVTTLGSVEDRVLQLYKVRNETVWYIEGMGTSTDKGASWDEEGKDFSPVAGSVAVDLSNKYIQSKDYVKDGAIETLTVTMTASNATKALKNFLASNQRIKYDVTVTIAAAADRISSITIEYIIPEHEIIFEEQNDQLLVLDSDVMIVASYSYKTDTGDIPITLD